MLAQSFKGWRLSWMKSGEGSTDNGNTWGRWDHIIKQEAGMLRSHILSPCLHLPTDLLLCSTSYRFHTNSTLPAWAPTNLVTHEPTLRGSVLSGPHCHPIFLFFYLMGRKYPREQAAWGEKILQTRSTPRRVADTKLKTSWLRITSNCTNLSQRIEHPRVSKLKYLECIRTTDALVLCCPPCLSPCKSFLSTWAGFLFLWGSKGNLCVCVTKPALF